MTCTWRFYHECWDVTAFGVSAENVEDKEYTVSIQPPVYIAHSLWHMDIWTSKHGHDHPQYILYSNCRWHTTFFFKVCKSVHHHSTIQINHQPDATIFLSIFWRLFTAQQVSVVFPPIIRSSMTAVAASGFTFVSWWQSSYTFYIQDVLKFKCKI